MVLRDRKIELAPSVEKLLLNRSPSMNTLAPAFTETLPSTVMPPSWHEAPGGTVRLVVISPVSVLVLVQLVLVVVLVAAETDEGVSTVVTRITTMADRASRPIARFGTRPNMVVISFCSPRRMHALGIWTPLECPSLPPVDVGARPHHVEGPNMAAPFDRLVRPV
jgi:hypothetical protein